MKINEAGIELIKSFESLRLVGYLCPAGIPTVGWGHTGPDVSVGMVITQRMAEQLLAGDLLEFEHGVSEAIGDCATTENQFSAMVSLAFNIGVPQFKSSTVLRMHKRGSYSAAGAAFLLWVWARVKGKKTRLAGLIRRRNAERNLYLDP